MITKIRKMAVCYRPRKNKQGPKVYLSLIKKIRKCYDISVSNLKELDVLIRKIKSLCAKDINTLHMINLKTSRELT